MDENVAMSAGGATNYVDLTTGIVSAYVSNNHLQPSEIASLIASTYAALTGLGQGDTEEVSTEKKPTSSQVRKSITPDALISFIDGKPYKTLKRHLTSKGTTIEQYRERYGLPQDYPVVAASYSEQRSKLAVALGLGNSRKTAETTEPLDATSEKPKRVGQPRKSQEA